MCTGSFVKIRVRELRPLVWGMCGRTRGQPVAITIDHPPGEQPMPVGLGTVWSFPVGGHPVGASRVFVAGGCPVAIRGSSEPG